MKVGHFQTWVLRRSQWSEQDLLSNLIRMSPVTLLYILLCNKVECLGHVVSPTLRETWFLTKITLDPASLKMVPAWNQLLSPSCPLPVCNHLWVLTTNWSIDGLLLHNLRIIFGMGKLTRWTLLYRAVWGRCEFVFNHSWHWGMSSIWFFCSMHTHESLYLMHAYQYLMPK